MTEITAPKSAVTAEQFADEIREQLKYTQGVTVEQAKPADVYVAASAAVRRHLVDSWMKTQADMVNGNTKAVGYLSAEFLMGKQLENALLNAGLTDQFDKAVEALGFDAQEVIDAEYEPGLGNGGLGRLAACFIDSLASLGVPAFVCKKHCKNCKRNVWRPLSEGTTIAGKSPLKSLFSYDYIVCKVPS